MTLSDELKTRIADIDGALDIVSQLRGVSFEWAAGGSAEIGLLAQDVQAVLPSLVHEGSDGYLTVEYPKLAAVLIEAVKELQGRLAAVEKGIVHA